MKDRVRKDEITNIYCPTEIMVTDYFTKPLQGSLVVKILHIIIGYSHPSTLLKKSSSSDKERVEISTSLATSDNVLNSETNNGTPVEALRERLGYYAIQWVAQCEEKNIERFFLAFFGSTR